MTKSSGFMNFANVISWGSIGVNVSACCGEGNLKNAISEFFGILISTFCRFKAERYKYPFQSVLKKDDVMHNPVLSSKLSFGSTIPQTSVNIFFDMRPHLSVVCWFGTIVIFSTVLRLGFVFCWVRLYFVELKCDVREFLEVFFRVQFNGVVYEKRISLYNTTCAWLD